MNFELLFDDGTGTPLDDSEANALFSSVAVFSDDPLAGTQGSFDAEDDQVGEITAFSMTAGVQAVPFTNDDPDVQLADNSLYLDKMMPGAVLNSVVRITKIQFGSGLFN